MKAIGTVTIGKLIEPIWRVKYEYKYKRTYN